MSPILEEDWSDSDEEVHSEVETSVLLGIPDGPISSLRDMNDVAVSRIGGLPAFIVSSEPPISCSHCRNCSNPAEMLVQLWCPLEDSFMDRVLYIWGCSRAKCQRKEGSVRAWRGLRFNEKYAEKLTQKAARRRAKEKAQVEQQKQKSSRESNPFSSGNASAPSPFGLGTQIFAGAPPVASASEPNQSSKDDTSESSDSDDDLLALMTSASIGETQWVSAPKHPALYLSTASEYLPPRPALAGHQVIDPTELDSGKGKNASWALEAYENSLEVDHVFERFSKRVAHESQQCIRYELAGKPLCFTSDPVFDALFPAPPAPVLPVTKPDFKVVKPLTRSYDTSSIQSCHLCKSKRVFECQLMPNLINVLTSMKEIDIMDGPEDVNDRTGMEWGTCMIFSCARDCCIDKDGNVESLECWREEVVLVQWDV